MFRYNGEEVATKADISRAYKTKGSASVSELETLAAGDTLENGDVYNVSNNGTLDNVGPTHAQDVRVRAGDNVVWIVPASPATPYWDILAGTTDFVTNSALSDALAGYLPLSAGSTKALTGELYVKPSMGIIGASIIANGGVLSLLGETGVTITTGATANQSIRFKAHNFVFSDVFAASPSTTIVARSDNGQANTLQLPTEDGTLVTGEYATTSEVQALFN